MTVKEAARLKGMPTETIYKQIERRSGLGRYFEKGADGVYEIDRRIVEDYQVPKPRGATQKIGFRVNPDELATIQQRAGREPVAVYCRRRALHE